MTARRLLPTLLLAAAALTATCNSDGTTGGGDLLVVSMVGISPPGATMIAGETLQFTAEPRTSGGVPVPGRAVTWASSNPAVASVNGATGIVTAVSVGGPVNITARVDGVTGVAQVSVSPVPVATVQVEPPEAELVVGQSVSFTARLLDAEGRTLPGRPVTWQSEQVTIANVTTTGTVVAVAPGSTTIRATAEGQTGTAAVVVVSRPAARLAFVSLPANAVAGQVLTPPVQVAVQDEVGQTVHTATTAITVSLADVPGSSAPASPASLQAAEPTLSGTLTRNAVDGIATFSDLLLTVSGPYTLRATAEDLSQALSNPFTIAAAPPQGLALATQPSGSAANGVPLPQQPVVRVVDVFGNGVLQAGLQVTATLVEEGAVLSGTLTVATNSQGIAAFTNLTLTGTSGTYTLSFAAGSFPAVVSEPIALGIGAATSLALVTAPSTSAQSGVQLAAQPVVELRNAGGTPVPQAGVAVGVTVSPGTATLGGQTLVLTDATGRAVFANLSIAGTVGSYLLSFGSAGLAGVSSAPIALSAGAAAALAMVTQPSSTAQSGVPLAQQPHVRLVDLSSNPVSLAGTVVTASLASGAGTLGGTLTATTNGSGVAMFTDLAIIGPAGGYTLGFSAPSLTGVTSGTVTITIGAVSQMGMVTQPPATAQSGAQFTTAPVVQLEDAAGTPVLAGGVSITVGIASGTGSLDGTLTVATDANGQATFGDLSITGLAGPHTLQFTAAGLDPAVSSVIDLVAGAATNMAAVSSTAQAGTAGQPVGDPPVVLVTDGGGNPVSGVAIAFAVTAGDGTSVPALPDVINTGADGIAFLTSWTLGTVAGVNNQITAANAGLAGSPIEFNASAAAGPAATVTAVSPTSQTGAILTTVTAPEVEVLDTHGNPVSGEPVTFTVTAGDGTIDPASPAIVPTGANGRAALTSWQLGPTAGVNNNTVTAEVGALPDVVFTATATVGPPTQITANSAQLQTAEVGSTVGEAPSVTVRDAGSNLLSGIEVTFTVAGGGTIDPTTPVATDASGVAALTSWTLGTLAGVENNTVTATVAGAGSVEFVASGEAGPAAKVEAASAPSQSAQAGTAVDDPPAVLVTDQFDNPVEGESVTFEVAAGGGSTVPPSPATIPTGSNGIAALGSWILGTSIGTDNNSVTATAGGLAGSPVTFTASGTAGPPDNLEAAPGSPTTQSGPVGEPVIAPAVVVSDAAMNPVSGVTVTFMVAGGGSIDPTSPAFIVTDGNGVAALGAWTLGPDIGDNNNSVTATVDGVAEPVVFTASGTAPEGGLLLDLAAGPMPVQAPDRGAWFRPVANVPAPGPPDVSFWSALPARPAILRGSSVWRLATFLNHEPASLFPGTAPRGSHDRSGL